MNIQERYLNVKRKLFEKAYDSLNDKQKEAAFAVNGPLLILAGAGSGKTTVLVKRIGFIIKYGNAYESDYVPADMDEARVEQYERALSLSPNDLRDILPEFSAFPCEPWRVLAITFTNKAANEIKTRLSLEIGNEEVASDIWAGTFHSICMRILRSNAEKAGLRPGFSIYDAEDSKKAIQSSMKALNIDEKTFPIKSVIHIISSAKDKLMTPQMLADSAGIDYRIQKIASIYEHYQNSLENSNVLDFDDIIMKTVELLKKDKEVLSYYQNRFRYVCVDEYQDTNYAQFVLTALLAGKYRNLMVVGDDDQSIYKFRGATIENILNFDKVFDETRVVKLEQNYRSTKNIINAANSVISHNNGRHDKTLWTAADIGEKITVRKLDDQNAEARFIVDRINRMVADKIIHYKDVAILYRNNAQSSVIERTFAKSGVPYRMLGGLRFNDRKEIRDIVAYLHLIDNHDDRERLLRIINEPRRKIGDKTLEAIEQIASEENCSLFHVIETAGQYVALEKSCDRLLQFASVIRSLSELVGKVSLETLVNQTLDRTGYRQMIIDMGEEEAERLDNLNEFVSGVIDYERSASEQPDTEPTLTGFLEENALVADVDKYDEKADAVVMMTMHSAKGLEFPVVFLPGMEDGLFPGMQSVMGSEAEIEEERRLAYVAITRAKKKLFLTHTAQRLLYGQTRYNPPSRFLEEIPRELLDEQTAARPRQETNLGHSFSSSVVVKPEERVTIGRPTPMAKPIAGTRFSPGDRVSHITFGEGEILSVKPMGADILYEIAFENVGTKKLMGSFAKLKKI